MDGITKPEACFQDNSWITHKVDTWCLGLLYLTLPPESDNGGEKKGTHKLGIEPGHLVESATH